MNRAIAPTRLALVLAESDNGRVNLNRAFSIPAYPVLNDAATVGKAHYDETFGMKVTVYRGSPP
jgi:hypothetical protein